VTLWKRGNVWWSIYYVDGIRHQESTETGNKKLALKIEKKFLDEAAAQKFGVTEVKVDVDMTFDDLSARFLSDGEVRPHHVDRLKNLLPFFADIPLVRLSKGLTSDFRMKRHKEKTVSDATINRDLSVLRHILYWGVEQLLIPANPLTRLRLARERRVRRPVLTLEEEMKLLAAAPEHLKRMIVAALDTGMRRGEILHQIWEDVDWQRKLLSVTRSKTPEGEAREIPLTTRLFELLNQNRKESGLIFTYYDQPIAYSIKTAWRASLRRAAIRRVRFHDLRHTHNTRLMEAGVMKEVRKALMGHQSGDKIQDIYTHVEMPIKRRAIAQLEEWVKTQTKTIGGNNANKEEGHNGDPGSTELEETVEEKDASANPARSGGQT
jgi:integrase